MNVNVKSWMGVATRACMVVIVVLATGMGGCVLIKGGLADAMGSKPDGRICGVWKSNDTKNQELSVGRARAISSKEKVTDVAPEGLMKLTRVTYDGKEQTILTESYEFFAFTIGEYQYANLLANSVTYPAWFLDKSRQSYIFRYQVKDDVLSVWVGDNDLYMKMVREKKIEEGGDALTAYLSKNGGDALFPANKKTTYKRVTEK